MTRIALFGAGGKMGQRLTANLAGSRFEVRHVEITAAGRDALADRQGVACVEPTAALDGARAVILAVPDRLIGQVAQEWIDRFDPGAVMIVLDAAAPHAGVVPRRGDVPLFVTHPCHPPLFSDLDDPVARRDFFGGVAAPQAIVCALEGGTDADYAMGEEIARTIYAPVTRSHRCSVADIAILEPALSETVGATFSLALRDATEEAIRRGVPREAAYDFMLGHLNIELAIAFRAFPDGQFSDGALQAIREAQPLIFREGWLDRVFDPEAVASSVRGIATA